MTGLAIKSVARSRDVRLYRPVLPARFPWRAPAGNATQPV